MNGRFTATTTVVVEGGGGSDRRRCKSGQPDDLSLVVPPSDHSDGLLMLGTSTQVSPINNLDEVAFDDYGLAGGTVETSGSMVVAAASAAAAARPPDLATTAQRSTSPSEPRTARAILSDGVVVACLCITRMDLAFSRTVVLRLAGTPSDPIPTGWLAQESPPPLAPISTSAAASPFSTLVGLIYDVDNAYDGHINTLLGSWLHHDGVPIIDPMAGE